MGAPGPSWRRNPLVVGPLLGWLIGMLWWAGLMAAFAAAGQRPATFALRGLLAPLQAAPWAVVGLVVGVVAWLVRGPWAPAASGLGLLGGGAYALAASPFDGWLAMTMPVDCLGGALAGAVAGAALGGAWRLLVRVRR